jgi:hypothetical protein
MASQLTRERDRARVLQFAEDLEQKADTLERQPKMAGSPENATKKANH